MKGIAKAFLAGNVTRDPELRTTPNGASVCGFSIAVNRSFRGSDGNMQDQVSFFDCSAWGKLGETINQYVKKGTGLIVIGRLEQRSWDDKTSGQKRSRVEVVVEDFSFAGGSSDGGSYGGGSYGGAAKSKTKSSAPVDDFVPEDVPDEDTINLDEIPF